MPAPAESLARVPLGARVVVRHLIEEGERATDALGELVARDDESVTVQTRRGPVRIQLADVVLAKPVPPTPGRGWRVASFLRRAGVAVLDLDGVLRDFDNASPTELGMTPEELVEIAFALPEVGQMITGRATYLDWNGALRERLLELGHPPELAAGVARAWREDMGSTIGPTVALVDELRGAGVPVFVLTNGTDRVPEELESIGLGHLVPGLLNSHVLGFAKPAPEVYAAAHAEIERHLGRTVGRAEVHFTDDRPANVDAARVFGWQARVFTLP